MVKNFILNLNPEMSNFKRKRNFRKNSKDKNISSKDKLRQNQKKNKINFKNDKFKGKSVNNENFDKNVKLVDKEQGEIFERGCLFDKINVITLLCIKNPTNENLKNLLSFCENQHNNTIYYTLKNIRDLILVEEINKNIDEIFDAYIYGRIIKTFEINVKNKYIGGKVIRLVEDLIDKEVYTEEFIAMLINILNIYNGKFLQRNFSRFKDEIVENLEDFYYKNDNFRSQSNVLKFLENKNGEIVYNFLNGISVDEKYAENEQGIMYERILNGLLENISYIEENNKINDDLLLYMKEYAGTNEKVYMGILRLFGKIKDKYYISFALKNSLRFRSVELDFIKEIYENGSKEMINALMANIFVYSSEFIIAMMMLCQRHNIKPPALFLYVEHFDYTVRETAIKLLEGDKIDEFDVYDKLRFNIEFNAL